MTWTMLVDTSRAEVDRKKKSTDIAKRKNISSISLDDHPPGWYNGGLGGHVDL